MSTAPPPVPYRERWLATFGHSAGHRAVVAVETVWYCVFAVLSAWAIGMALDAGFRALPRPQTRAASAGSLLLQLTCSALAIVAFRPLLRVIPAPTDWLRGGVATTLSGADLLFAVSLFAAQSGIDEHTGVLFRRGDASDGQPGAAQA